MWTLEGDSDTRSVHHSLGSIGAHRHRAALLKAEMKGGVTVTKRVDQNECVMSSAIAQVNVSGGALNTVRRLT